MTRLAAYCQMCGQPLVSADSICTRCDTALAQDAQVDTSHWLVCPQCKTKIPHFEEVSWPENAPWYRPTTLRPRCPECKSVFRRKYETRAFHRASFILMLLVLLSHVFLATSAWVWGLRFLSLAALASMTSVVLYRAYRDPTKYVPEQKH